MATQVSCAAHELHGLELGGHGLSRSLCLELPGLPLRHDPALHGQGPGGNGCRQQGTLTAT